MKLQSVISSPSRFLWLSPYQTNISQTWGGKWRNLDPVDWGEWELCNNSAVKDGVEHRQEGGECKTLISHVNPTCFNINILNSLLTYWYLPIANMDFILTIVKSLFVFFSFSSSCSKIPFRVD